MPIRPEHAELEAARDIARLDSVLAHSFDAAAVLSPQGGLSYVSPAAERLTGYSTTELQSASAFDFVHPDDQSAAVSALETVVASDQASTVCRIRTRDREWRWVEIALHNHLDDPLIGGIVANLRDITERRMAEDLLRQSEALYRSIVETTQEGVWLVDRRGVTIFANATMADMIGVAPRDMVGTSMFDFLPATRRAVWEDHLQQRLQGVSARYQQQVTRADGSSFWVQVSSGPLRDPDGHLIGALAMVADIDELKRTGDELERLALRDGLTGLANRALLMGNARQALDRARVRPGPIALLALDIDHFKVVNDSLGHDQGDDVLRAVAARLASTAGPADTLARLSGDEFAMLCESLEDETAALTVAQRLSDALRTPITVGGSPVFLSASIGIAVSAESPADVMLANAEIAMHRAKERGRSRIEVFDTALHEAVRSRLLLHNDLHQAIAEDQLIVHYQPMLELLEQRVVGVEALVRWQHPALGMLGPDQFVGLAEQSGLICPIGLHILHLSLAQLAQWDRSGTVPVRLAVNLSPRQLTDGTLVEDVVHALELHGIDPQRLVLEITETALMDDAEQALAMLRELKSHGIRLAIDDFGTGYSSLLYLRRFPIDEIKIDRSFVAGLPDESEARAIVESIVGLASAVGVRTVAEGIETDGQLDAARSLGCDLGQGFLWCHPAPADEITWSLGAADLGRL